MSETGNILKKAHDLLVKNGNCKGQLHNEETGQYCAWGALSALECQLPKDFTYEPNPLFLVPGLPRREQQRVVRYNNLNPGQPVIDLFAKAAANEGYDLDG